MRVISSRLISGNECDTLLKVTQLINKTNQNTIKSQEKTIQLQDIRHITTEHLIDACETDKTILKTDLNYAKTSIKWIKAGWILTTIVLTITTGLALVK